MKIWKYKYNDNEILVKNKGINGEELYVNDKLQDKNLVSCGLETAKLSGKLSTGEEIKVSLGGFWKVHCCLFVDNVLQEPVDGDK